MSNDLSLGYARAQRDLGCRYAVGFYVDRIEEDKARMIRLRVKGAGLEVRYPGQYKVQSPEKMNKVRLMAAFLQPEMFQTDYLRTHLFLLQPRSTKEWDALIAINFPVTFSSEENPEYEAEFGVVVSAGAGMTHSFNRSVSIRPKQSIPREERRFTFLEPLVLTPGTYSISTVVSTAGDNAPAAVNISINVPDVPLQDLTLVPPILGRPREKNIVIRGDGPEEDRGKYSSEELAPYDVQAAQGSFEPLLVLRTKENEALLSRNKACLVGAKRVSLPDGTSVERSLTAENENPVEMPTFPLSLAKGEKVRCQNIFETLNQKSAGEGQYTFDVIIEKSSKFDEVEHHLPLAISKGEPQQD
jgi:hypothetical protein